MADQQDTPKLTYYQRNRDHVRERAREYYHRVSEGKVNRRNQKRDQQQEKRPRGRPRKVITPVEDDQRPPVNAGDAYKSPDNVNDLIFEEL